MEFRQLRYFIAVAEEANFTRAAARVHISQSGLSAQIRQLEADLGADLIDRSTRTATLTPAGAAALEQARATLASMNALRQAVDEVMGLISGRLVIGMVSGCTLSSLFDALAAFHHSHPGVEITLVEDNSERLTERVRSGTADAAVIGTVGKLPPDLEAISISSERLVAAVPLEHPLAKRTRITLAQISTHPIVCMPQGTAPRTMLDQACTARGVSMNIVLQAGAPAAVADLATRGFGIAILTQSMATVHATRLKALLISDLHTPAGLAMIWRGTTTPALREFLSCSHEAFSGPREPTA
jgi:DNA-binding transcriptional LysR family regulator